MNQTPRVSHIIRNKRFEHKVSQVQLAKILGLKNGQFFSNIERNLCGLPVKYFLQLSEILKTPLHELKEAYLLDAEEYVSTEIDEQLKDKWNAPIEVAPPVIEKVVEKPEETKAFVQALRASMDNANLVKFIR
jgi:transcriptional regulator with XRE-family HTH domain